MHAVDASETQPAAPVAMSRRRVALVALALAIAVGVGLRFAAGSDLWLDEVLTVRLARLPLGELRAGLVRDGAPPLFYVLLHGWTAVLGTGDVAVRALSGAFGVAAIGVGALAARDLTGDPGRRGRAATAGALIVAVSPFAIRYSTEARMYSLVMLLVLVGVIVGRAAWRADGWGWVVGVALVTAGLVLTLYWSWYLVLATVAGLIVVALVDPDRRGPAGRLLAGVGGGMVLFLPWLPTFRDQLAHTGTPWDDPVHPVAGMGRALLAVGGERGAARVVFAVLIGAAIAAGVARRSGDRATSTIAVLAGLGLATLAVGVLASAVAGTGFQPRYAAPAVPLLLLAAALAVADQPDARVRGAALTVLALTGLVGGWQSVRASRTASTELAATLRPLLAAGDVVAYCPDQLGPATARLLGPDVRQVRYPDLGPASVVDWTDYEARNAAASPARFAQRLDASTPGRVYLVWSGGYRTLGDSCERVVNALAARRAGGEVVGTARGPAGAAAEIRRFEP